ncbi:MAPEG family protein [Sphingomonas immobilis]|uniref:MAPEG family protein n=1 Tax=Sphingomonas immobilis TaxID=3063997 RepID=A0ABT8ZZH0_9SPHN|nr:MAPEG family protein [Sphingomonas sp. CA1-15]MDO7842982.1 MAPEG family protein [Sphingomonas sp. CA1-15]
MHIEVFVLAWGCVLALVHIFAAATLRTKQYGSDWNAGPRDEEMPPPNPTVGRLTRAQANFFETFPLVVAAVAGLGIMGIHTHWTAIGAHLWLFARVAYLPLYVWGVKYVRSAAFMVSLAGIVIMLWPLLFALHG